MLIRALVMMSIALSALATHAQPVLSFDAESVSCSGLTPGKGAITFVALREAKGYGLRVTKGAEVRRDDDGDGNVILFQGRSVPWYSVFIAVDASNGSSAIGGPHPELYAVGRERLAPGQIRKVVHSGDFAAFLLVRPGIGAWSLTVEDSGTYDDDPTPDGQLGVVLERMLPVGDAPAPPRTFERNDVMFAIDPIKLSVVEWRAQ